MSDIAPTIPVYRIPYRPRSFFRAFHDRTQRQAVIVAHRRAGKTTACLRDLERDALRSPLPDTRYAYIAPLYSQAKSIAWDILKAGATAIPNTKINESELRCDYFSGGQVRLFGGDNPDSLRGLKLDGVVLDEYADMKPNLYKEVIIPALMDRKGWAVFIGTAKGRDAFHRIWAEALANPDWYTLMLKASETGILDPADLAKAHGEMSVEQYNREFECSFDEAGVSQFISGAMVQAAVDRGGKPLGPRVMGIDVARFGDDRSVIVYRDGDVLVDIGVFHGQDTMQMVGHITAGINVFKPEAVFVDVAGVGGGVVDRLNQLGFRIIDVNAGTRSSDEGKWPLLRDEMWHKMREWLTDRGCIPNRSDLAADLTSATYKYDHRNRVKLVSKQELKAEGLPSPDIADALGMTFAYPVAHSDMQNLPPWIKPHDKGPSEENVRWGWG